jgi:hypothetical protein
MIVSLIVAWTVLIAVGFVGGLGKILWSATSKRRWSAFLGKIVN